MPLVTDADVKAIIDTSLGDLSAFIATADTIVSEELADKGLSTARLTEIERYLAAHFVAMRDEAGRVASERHDGVGTVTYTSEGGSSAGREGFGLTRYGQQAIALDTTGTLARLGRLPAQFRVL